MGNWSFPEHYTPEAQAFKKGERAVLIQHMVETALPVLRAKVRALGYALAVHGSLARDLDLVAIPWTEEAVDQQILVDAMCEACRMATGWGHLAHGLKPGEKPHGRQVATIYASSDVYLDLSIMPRLMTSKSA